MPRLNPIKKLIALALSAIVLTTTGQAATGTISPSPFQLVLDANGHPASLACVWTYTAGTSTPVATYTDVGLSVANANPIIASSAGRFTAFLTPGVSYKFVYEAAPCSSISHGSTTSMPAAADNIAAVPASAASVDIATATAGEAISAGQCAYLSDGSGSKTAGSWYKCDSANTYSSTLPEVGIAPSAIASGSSGTIRLAGSVTGLSSLSVGAEIYVGTAGALTSTAPTNKRHLGHADTATSLVLSGDPAVNIPAVDPFITDGRLTLTTALPVTTSDVTAATTVYFTPYKGNAIALFDGTATWNLRTLTELSIAVPATTASCYDVFAYDNSGTPALELSAAWSTCAGAGARASALTTQSGVLVKSGATTRKYLGSFATTGVSGQTEDSAAKRYLWNYYHRLRRTLVKAETNATWAYTTATVRQANASTANQVESVIGWAETELMVKLVVSACNGAQSTATAGIGEDSTTTFAAAHANQSDATGLSGCVTIDTALNKYPAIGKHVYSWNEYAQAAGTWNWYGAPSAPNGHASSANGLTGFIEG